MQARIDVLDSGRVRRYSIRSQGEDASFAEVLDGWQHSRDLRAFFLSLLADAPMEAFFWESRPLTRATLGEPYEFVLVDSPTLVGVRPDAHAFAEAFESADEAGVAVFPNLGGDALLIAPSPRAPLPAYAHLAAFVRAAPESQQHALLRVLGRTLAQRIGRQPLWTSTCGLGVFWLHVRLDSRPKYYSHAPYKQP